MGEMKLKEKLMAKLILDESIDNLSRVSFSIHVSISNDGQEDG